MGDHMTEAEYQGWLETIERLLNDPDVPFDAGKVWSLLSEMSPHIAAHQEKVEPCKNFVECTCE